MIALVAQARAMETRFGQKKSGDKEKVYVHMRNATLCATERTICCILENYQTNEVRALFVDCSDRFVLCRA